MNKTFNWLTRTEPESTEAIMQPSPPGVLPLQFPAVWLGISVGYLLQQKVAPSLLWTVKVYESFLIFFPDLPSRSQQLFPTTVITAFCRTLAAWGEIKIHNKRKHFPGGITITNARQNVPPQHTRLSVVMPRICFQYHHKFLRFLNGIGEWLQILGWILELFAWFRLHIFCTVILHKFSVCVCRLVCCVNLDTCGSLSKSG